MYGHTHTYIVFYFLRFTKYLLTVCFFISYPSLFVCFSISKGYCFFFLVYGQCAVLVIKYLSSDLSFTSF